MAEQKESLYVVFGEHTERVADYLHGQGHKIVGKDRTLDAAAIIAPNLDEVPETYLILASALVSGVVDTGIDYGGALLENLKKLRMAVPKSRVVLIVPEEIEPDVLQQILYLAIYDVHRAAKVSVSELPGFLSTRKTIADYGSRTLPVLVPKTEKVNVAVEAEMSQKRGFIKVIWELIRNAILSVLRLFTVGKKHSYPEASDEEVLHDYEIPDDDDYDGSLSWGDDEGSIGDEPVEEPTEEPMKVPVRAFGKNLPDKEEPVTGVNEPFQDREVPREESPDTEGDPLPWDTEERSPETEPTNDWVEPEATGEPETTVEPEATGEPETIVELETTGEDGNTEEPLTSVEEATNESWGTEDLEDDDETGVNGRGTQEQEEPVGIPEATHRIETKTETVKIPPPEAVQSKSKKSVFMAQKVEPENSNIHYMPHQLVAVWSPGGWAKSYTAFNLASVAEALGFDVALINYDLQCPELDTYFNIKQTGLIKDPPGKGVMTFGEDGFHPQLMPRIIMEVGGIKYLPAGNKMGNPGTPDIDIDKLEQALRNIYQRSTHGKPAITIVDAGRCYEYRPTLAAITQATVVIVPTDGTSESAEPIKQQIEELNRIGRNPRFIELCFTAPGRKKITRSCDEYITIAFDWAAFINDRDVRRPQCSRLDGRRAWENVLHGLVAPTTGNFLRRLAGKRSTM